MMGLPGREKNLDDIYSRFDTKHECDGRTDRRTLADGQYRAYAQRRAVKKPGEYLGNNSYSDGMQLRTKNVLVMNSQTPNGIQSVTFAFPNNEQTCIATSAPEPSPFSALQSVEIKYTFKTRRQARYGKHRLSTFGRRAFAVAGPSMFNALPDDLRDPAVSITTFGQSMKTKTHLFSAYQHVQCIRGISRNALYKCTIFTYLLTYYCKLIARQHLRHCVQTSGTHIQCQ